MHHPFAAQVKHIVGQLPSKTLTFLIVLLDWGRLKPWQTTDFIKRKVCMLHLWFEKEIKWWCQIRCVYRKKTYSLTSCPYIYSILTISQAFGNFHQLVLWLYQISLIMSGMKIVTSNGFSKRLQTTLRTD